MIFYTDCMHCQQILALVVIMHSCAWLNKSRMPPAVSNLHFSDRCVKHYVAKSVQVAATGKQETVKEAQVCNESGHGGIASTVENTSKYQCVG